MNKGMKSIKFEDVDTRRSLLVVETTTDGVELIRVVPRDWVKSKNMKNWDGLYDVIEKGLQEEYTGFPVLEETCYVGSFSNTID